jgi:hypothetical protein
MLEFPLRPLPPDVNSPPYVLFGIRGKECFSDLPDKIPLKLVLHFAPKLNDYLLPAPTELPKESVNIGLLTPYIGIDIQHLSVALNGLSWIIKRMLQLSGRPAPNDLFDTMTFSMPVCLEIHRTWTALELPYAGLDSLRTHMLMRVMDGPTLTLIEMRLIWDSFIKNHDIVREMAVNYMRAHAQRVYTIEESADIRAWIARSKTRKKMFKGWEVLVPEFGTSVDAEREPATDDDGRTVRRKEREENKPERDN